MQTFCTECGYRVSCSAETCVGCGSTELFNSEGIVKNICESLKEINSFIRIFKIDNFSMLYIYLFIGLYVFTAFVFYGINELVKFGITSLNFDLNLSENKLYFCTAVISILILMKLFYIFSTTAKDYFSVNLKFNSIDYLIKRISKNGVFLSENNISEFYSKKLINDKNITLEDLENITLEISKIKKEIKIYEIEDNEEYNISYFNELKNKTLFTSQRDMYGLYYAIDHFLYLFFLPILIFSLIAFDIVMPSENSFKVASFFSFMVLLLRGDQLRYILAVEYDIKKFLTELEKRINKIIEQKSSNIN